MEELSSATVALPFRLTGSALCEKQLGIARLKLIADAAGLAAAANDFLCGDEAEKSMGDVEIQILSGCKSGVNGRVSLSLGLHAGNGLPGCEDDASGFLQVRGNKSVFLIDYVPLWGSASIIGERPEMEDALMVVPNFYGVPLWMLIGKQVVDGLDPNLVRLPAHFFGVYDGHGGAQVANYCRERIHDALIEQLCSSDKGFDCSSPDGRTKHWEKAFTECFGKVDDEVAGKVHGGEDEAAEAFVEPVAAETVGSTAVVALICSSHIIVANCGDSRAVLFRGKESMPLSSDHKPNREDEYARIEGQGGKVIHWNGHRVLGVLAMSRAIGDRFLKPWIIPEPEVTVIPRSREDECLILASDGLWDVLSNDEVCEIARKRILLWHKKNGDAGYQKGEGADPAAQSAADYLTKLAIQKGSKDNITVIVVDLKARRKFKSKS